MTIGVFIARGKEDALVTKNIVPGETVYGEKKISVDAPVRYPFFFYSPCHSVMNMLVSLTKFKENHHNHLRELSLN